MKTFSMELPGPGGALTPSERLQVATEARQVLGGNEADTDSSLELLAAGVVADPSAVDAAAVVALLGEGRVIEAVGIAVRVVAADIRARGLGTEPAPLIAPRVLDASTFGPLPAARKSWGPVATADPPAAGLYPDAPCVPRVFQALSVAPAEARAVIEMTEAWHLPIDRFFQPGSAPASLSISRAQLELAAARVSVINECFYCTLAHSSMLAGAGTAESCDLDLTALAGTSGAGVPDGDAIVGFVDAAVSGTGIDSARALVVNRLGEDAMVQIASTTGVFSAMNRIADSLDIPFDLGPEAAAAQAAQVPGAALFPGAAASTGVHS